MENRIENQTKWRRWLFNEVSLFTSIIVVVIGVVFWISDPIEDCSKKLITIDARITAVEVKNAEIEISLNLKLTGLQVQLDRVEARQIEVLKGLAELQAVH